MLKSALRLETTTSIDVEQIKTGQTYERVKIAGAVLDTVVLEKVHFKGSLFADCGMRETKFVDCTFDNCIFAGCYMKGATFEHCKIRGSHFEICTTTGLILEDTKVDHVDFFRCILPFEQLKGALTTKHSVNDVMMLNCASEAHRTGRWREAAYFLQQHRIEQRTVWKKMVYSRDPYYKKYSKLQRIRAFGRLVTSFLLMTIFGDVVSIYRMLLLGLILCFVVFPLWIMWSDVAIPPFPDTAIPPFLSFLWFYIVNYWSYFLEFFNMMLGTSIPLPYQPIASNPELTEIVSRIVGIIYLSVFANVATKSLSNGPSW